MCVSVCVLCVCGGWGGVFGGQQERHMASTLKIELSKLETKWEKNFFTLFLDAHDTVDSFAAQNHPINPLPLILDAG